MLEERVAYRIYGSTLPKQGQVKRETMSSYLLALKSYHIERHLSFEAFDTPFIAFIIKDKKSFFLKQKATYLLITKNILKKITVNKSININKLNIDKAFKVVWAGFLRLGKITYTGTELKKASFLDSKVTRSNVSFSKENQYAVLCLKQSKTNTKHTSAKIVFAVTSDKSCPIAALSRLYTLDPQPANAPLFRLSSSVFLRFSVMTMLKKRLSLAGLVQSNYFGHSFCNDAPQYRTDHSIFDMII